MKFVNYSLIIEDLFGVQIKFHWSILPAMFIFSGFFFQPVRFLSFFVLILIHEVGHALIIRSFSFKNHELIIHGVGGACVWSGFATQKQKSIIAWGGILAQLLVFIIFLLLPNFVNFQSYHSFWDQIFRTLFREYRKQIKE